MLKKISIVIFLAFAVLLIGKLYSLPSSRSDTAASSVQLNIYDAGQLKELLDKNADLVNKTDDNGNTALCNAALYGKLDAAKLLLEKGADVNVRSSQYPPLYWAAWGGDMEMAKLLLRYKADVNIKNERGCTPLYEAAQKGFADVVGLLASHGADVNMPGEYGSTALHRAAQNGYLDTVRVLLAHKADINVRDDGGRTALQAAAGNSHQEIVELLEGQSPEITDQKLPGWSRLHEAVKAQDIEEIKRLLDADMNVNITDCNGVTALQNAAEEGAVNITALLLSRGADPNMADTPNGNTPLHKAAGKGHKDIVALLLAHQAKADAVNTTGLTPCGWPLLPAITGLQKCCYHTGPI